MNNKNNPWSLVLKFLRQSWQQILVTHVIFMALGVVLFAPLIGFTGRLLLKLSGQTALADQDIAYFLLSPIGMLALILFAALLIGILAFEQAILIRIAISVMHGKSVRTVDALEYTALRIHSVFIVYRQTGNPGPAADITLSCCCSRDSSIPDERIRHQLLPD